MDDKVPSGEIGKTMGGETRGGGVLFVYVGPRVAGIGWKDSRGFIITHNKYIFPPLLNISPIK